MPLLVQQTGLALQELPPTPMTEMGLQLTPTRALMGPRTTPSKPARRPTKGSLACRRRIFVVNIETIEQHRNSYSEGLVAALNGTSVALSLPGFKRAGRGGDRKKGQSEEQEENDGVSTSEHIERLRGFSS